jgi:hypothetical protein
VARRRSGGKGTQASRAKSRGVIAGVERMGKTSFCFIAKGAQWIRARCWTAHVGATETRGDDGRSRGHGSPA